MSSSVRTRSAGSRSRREDGESTKARIIEAAGKLFAEYGYAETTSKQICEAANTNITAVNYHFGSRDGLYEVIAQRVSEYMLDTDFLSKLIEMEVSPGEKLKIFIRYMCNSDYGRWERRLWAREIVSPSPIWVRQIHEYSFPKFEKVLRILGDLTGIPAESCDLHFCFLCIMSPVMMLLIAHHDRNSPCSDYSPARLIDRDQLADNVIEFVFAGLEKFAAKYAKKKE